MKSVQRKFGTFMKRSDNEQDVQTVLAEFKAVDDMLDRVRPLLGFPKHEAMLTPRNR